MVFFTQLYCIKGQLKHNKEICTDQIETLDKQIEELQDKNTKDNIKLHENMKDLTTEVNTLQAQITNDKHTITQITLDTETHKRQLTDCKVATDKG